MRALRVLGWIGIATLGVIVLGVGILLGISRGWQRERLTPVLEQLLSEALGAEVRVGALEGPLYPWLILQRVELSGDVGRVRLGQLRIELDHLDLTERHLALRDVGVTDLEADLRRLPPAAAPAAGAPAAEPPPLPVSISVAHLRVDPARVELTDASGERPLRLAGRLQLELENLTLDRSLAVEPMLRQLTARLLLQDASGQLGAVMLRDGTLRATWTAGGWSLTDASAGLGGGRVSARGSGDLRRIEALHVDGEALDLAALAPLLPDVPLTGRANVGLDLSGELAAPRGHARIEVRGLRVREVDVGDVGLQAASEDGTHFALTALEAQAHGMQLASVGQAHLERLIDGVRISNLQLRSRAQRLEIDGSVHVDRVDQLRLRAEQVDLGALAALAGTASVSGRFTGSAELDGPLPVPHGTLQGRVEGVEVRGWTAQRIEVDARIDAEQARLRLKTAGPEARLELDLPRTALLEPADAWREPALRVRLDAEALDPARFAALLPDATVSGAIDAHLELVGGHPWPTLSGTLAARDLRIAGAGLPALDGVDAALAFEQQTLRIDALALASEEGSPRLAGELSLAGTPERPRVMLQRLALEVDSMRARLAQPTELTLVDGGARFEELVLETDRARLELAGYASPQRVRDLRIVSRALDPGRLAGTTRVGGTIDAELRLDGPFPLPRVSGSLTWNTPRWEQAHLEQLSARVQSDATRFTLDLDARREGREVLSARIVGPVQVQALARLLERPDAMARIRAQRLDLAWLAPLLPRSTRPRGFVDANLELQGGKGAPALSGNVQVDDAHFQVALLRQEIGPVQARLALEGDRLRVTSLRAKSGPGVVEVTGSIELPWKTDARADLAAALDGFEVRRPGVLQSGVHGALRLEGPLDAPRLLGELELRDTRVQLPEADDRFTREIRVIGLEEDATRAASAAPGPLARASWDLGVRIPRGTWVRGLGANVEVEGELRATREAGASAGYAGALRVVRGSYRLEGRTFDIQQGVAAFTGSAELDPQIHVVTLRRIRDVTIIAILRGWSSAPELQLQSQPPLSQDEILAYLIFGRPTDQLGGQDNEALTSLAGEMAGGIAMDRFSGLLLDRLPIDTLEFDVDGSGSPVLGVGKYVSEDVFVRYRQPVGGESGEEVEVEWQLTPDVSVQSEISSQGTGGADVIWSRDY
jgi:translocation and assembly module TamB